MKTLCLVLALLVLGCAAAMAQTATATIELYKGFQLVAPPLVPINPDPVSVFGGATFGVDSQLTRWDPNVGGISYDSLSSDPYGGYGGVLLGDGAWLFSERATITYTGVADGVPDASGTRTDMYISLPGQTAGGGGWHIIGYPFNKSMQIDNGDATGSYVQFTDGTQTLSWSAAVAAGWVESGLTGWNATTGGYTVQYDQLGDSTSLDPGHGYWCHTFKSNIAMILPASYSN